MSTRTQNHNIEAEDHADFSRREPEGRLDREIGRAPAEGGPRAARRGRHGPARAQLVGEALDRARAGVGVGELPDGVREQLTDAMLDELLAGREGEAEILGTGGLLGDLTRRLVERALSAELTGHLGYEPGGAPLGGSGNARNGGTPKTLLTDHGAVRIDTPRDRQGTFEPQLVKKGQRRVPGLDEKIVALYAGGMTTREIERYLGELYGPGVSRDTVSRITAAVLDDAKTWQTRPLEQVYPILYLDALIVKIRDGQAVRNFACYLAIGVNTDGERDVLGMWFQKTEGAKFWLQVLTDLKTRGVLDVLVCCVDGLTGFPEAIEAVYPDAIVQTCIVHMIRNSLRFTSYKDRKQLVKDLRMIYTAPTEEAATAGLETFAGIWDSRYPQISQSWRDAWERVIPYFAFPPALRRAVYTTNQIESLNSVLRKAIRIRGHFPDDESARKLLYLAIRNHENNWKRPPAGWYECLASFHAHFQDRLTRHT